MSWAAKRRFIILLIVGAVVVAFLSVVLIATFKQVPSCSDGVQNQNEEGVDCGGPCSYLCVEQERPPTVLFTQAINNGAGRVDIVASVENRNVTSAAKNVPYRVQLYARDHTLIFESSGVIDLPAGARVPVFIPGAFAGKQTVANAFLTIASSSPQWFRMTADPRIVPAVSNIKQGGAATAPRVEAVLSNTSTTALANVPVVVFVRDEQGTVIAASQTVVSAIPAQGQAVAIFTWNSAFTRPPASLEVSPLIPLP